jgi:hypothetical protein
MDTAGFLAGFADGRPGETQSPTWVEVTGDAHFDRWPSSELDDDPDAVLAVGDDFGFGA